MKVLVVGDVHIYGKNPVCRIDDLVFVQFEKLKEVIDISNKYGVPIVQTGDLTDSPDIGHRMVSELSSILSKCHKGVYIVYGQHDLLYHNLDSYKSTALGVLESSGIVQRIQYFGSDYNDYYFSWANWGEKISNSFGNYLLTHKPIINKKDKLFWMNDYFDFDYLKNYFGIMICGDWHRRYIYSEIRKGKETILINPGALTRREANQDSIDTFPSVVLIDLDNGEYEVIPLKCAKPADEVISDKHLKLSKVTKNINISIQKIIEIIETIKNKKTNREYTFRRILVDAMKDNDLEDDVIEALKDIMYQTWGKKLEY